MVPAPSFWSNSGMGWMGTLLLGDIGNRLDIADAERNIAALHRQTHSASRHLAAKNREIAGLRDEVARNRLAITALTRFLIARGIVGEEDLDAFITEIDLSDGTADGKLSDESTGPRLLFPAPEGTPSVQRE